MRMFGYEREYLEILEKREKHLTARTQRARQEGKHLSFDEAEKSALGWAIANLRHLVKDKKPNVRAERPRTAAPQPE